MRRCVVAGVVLTCLVIPILTTATTAVAAGERDLPGGARIDATARIGGRYADPPGIWMNPCAEGERFVSERSQDDAHSRARTRIASDGVTEALWQRFCVDPETGRRNPTTISEWWIADPRPEDLVPALVGMIEDYLDPPQVEWPNMSPEHGWLFVKVPMDFRVNNLTPITVTATVSNSIGTATASATATPDTVLFDSGEGGGATCSAAQATEPYVARVFGACAYTYQNSSAIAPNGYSFTTTTSMQWAITSAPANPTIPGVLDTFVSQDLAVSEVQAIVTCYGRNC